MRLQGFGWAASIVAATASAQTTVRVNLGVGGAQANERVWRTSTADDGRIAYVSDASNLVSGDTNVRRDVFVSSPSGATERVSVASGGTQANGDSGVGLGGDLPVAISASGRYVAFPSVATNLVPSDTNGLLDVFLRDRQANTTVRVSVPAAGGQANGESFVSPGAISSDGRYVVFHSAATNLVAGDTNLRNDVFLRDLQAPGITTRVSLGPLGVQGNEQSLDASISPDGRYVVYHSGASNLVPGDANSALDVFLHDRQSGTTELVSLASTGGQVANASSWSGSGSADGRYVAFLTGGAFVPEDTNGMVDVYVRDVVSGTVERVSVGPGAAQASGGLFGCVLPRISADGRLVAFASDFTNLLLPDTNDTQDVYVRDRFYGATYRASSSTANAQGNGHSSSPSLSPNGLYAGFASQSTNLVAGDTNGWQDAFLRTLNLPPLPPQNDDCGSPEAIAGLGTFAFDTTSATTGMQGQGDYGCWQGLARDVWFSWTASFSGTAQLSLCGQTTVGSKISVYAGSACPAGAALACNDDACGLQSSLCFPTTAGAAYLLQIGSSPGFDDGTGTFTLSQSSVEAGACAPIDDGTAENASGYFSATGGASGWLQRFGEIGESTSVIAISTAWGSPLAPPAQLPPDGSPVQVALWDDPDDDGDPDDAVLLQLVSGTLAGSGTNALQSFALSPAVRVSGYFFVGAGLAHGPNRHPIPHDQPGTCSGFDRAWSFGCSGGGCALDFADLAANQWPPRSLSNWAFGASQLLLRPTCGGAVAFCVPATAGVLPCPCSNPGQPGKGCDNSDATGGASLAASGDATVGSDTLVFTTAGQKASSVSIVLQGSAASAGGAVFGQGIRCTAGSLKRLYTKVASGGSIAAPQSGDPSVSAQSAALGDTISPGGTRWYQVYYRDPTVLGGCPPGSTFNITQGLVVAWS